MLLVFWLVQQAAWVVPLVLVVVVLLWWPKQRYPGLRLVVVGGLTVVTGWMLSLPTSVSCSFHDGWPPRCAKTVSAERAGDEPRPRSAEMSGGDDRVVRNLVGRLDRDEAIDGAASFHPSVSAGMQPPPAARAHLVSKNHRQGRGRTSGRGVFSVSTVCRCLRGLRRHAW